MHSNRAARPFVRVQAGAENARTISIDLGAGRSLQLIQTSRLLDTDQNRKAKIRQSSG